MTDTKQEVAAWSEPSRFMAICHGINARQQLAKDRHAWEGSRKQSCEGEGARRDRNGEA